MVMCSAPVSYCDSRRGAGNVEGDTQATENQTQKLFVEPRVQGQLLVILHAVGSLDKGSSLGRDQLIAWPSEQELSRCVRIVVYVFHRLACLSTRLSLSMCERIDPPKK